MQILRIWYIVFHTAFLYCSWCSHSRYSWYTLPSKSCQLILPKYQKRKTCKFQDLALQRIFFTWPEIEYRWLRTLLRKVTDSVNEFAKKSGIRSIDRAWCCHRRELWCCLFLSWSRSRQLLPPFEGEHRGWRYQVKPFKPTLDQVNHQDSKIMLTFKIWICWRNPFTSPEASSLITAWTFKCTTTSYQKLTKA